MRHDGDVILAQNAHWVKYTPACQFTHTMQTSMHISTVQKICAGIEKNAHADQIVRPLRPDNYF